jgi:plastocyanin
MKRIFLILGLIIVAPACFLLMTQVLRSKQTQESIPVEVVIRVDKHGFSPKEVTIKPGTIVHWKNVSGAPQTVNSNDYPTNQLHKELNFGVFNSGSSFVFVFSQPGSYGYHNQFHPEQQGIIIVKR